MIDSTYKRIAIVGCAGSGKSTLALKLQKKLPLPLFHLDQFYWLPHWEKVDLEKFKTSHNQLCDKENWIIEGSYIKFFPYRAQQADVIIFTDVPRYLCIWYVLKRSWTHCGEVIPGNPEGCKQRIFSWKFLSFLQWVWNFNKRYRSMILNILEELKDSKQVYIFKSFQEMNEFIEKI